MDGPSETQRSKAASSIFFVTRAVDAHNQESEDSNEISATIP
jgi:hypothetical protein